MMIHNEDNETIVAHCTPQGSGALALIRLSGKDSFEIARKISVLSSGKQITELPTHTIAYGQIVSNDGQILDHVLFFLMRGPRSFTGQDTVEISCHNNPFIIQAIIQAACACGARPARQGEFSRRAVLNNKIDLIQAEAINEVISAQNALALKQSLAQLQGSLSEKITQIEELLIHALAYCQASFEFVEEEGLTFERQIKQLTDHVLDFIQTLKKTFDHQQQIRQGVRIALIGSVNAGKSSLFNALLNKERSIVTAIAGTTRDSIEAGIFRAGSFVTLIDTAGLRQTEDIIEQIGIERSFQEAHAADIILLVRDSSRNTTEQEEKIYQELYNKYTKKIIPVCTKSDLNRTALDIHQEHACITVSSKIRENIDALEQAVESKIKELFARFESPFLINQRQQTLLRGLEQQLQKITELLEKNPLEYEIIAYHLQDTIAQLSELTGKTISEKAMDAVFRTFCVGK